MYYVVQENVFKEENYDNLMLALNRLKLPYEIVKVLPFIEDFEFETNRTDVFPFGAVKMSRLSRQYRWKPGSQLNENHDFQIYKNYYHDNLLNWDSKIIKFGNDDLFSKEIFFARPTMDTKVFTGKVFDMGEWTAFRERSQKNGHTSLLDDDTEIQISSVKNIQNEIRFWIVKGEIVTASQYKLGNRLVMNDNVDASAYRFCEKMIELFELNDAFVMDVCLTDNQYKIIECGCINSAGFYQANLQKLLMKLETAFS